MQTVWRKSNIKIWRFFPHFYNLEYFIICKPANVTCTVCWHQLYRLYGLLISAVGTCHLPKIFTRAACTFSHSCSPAFPAVRLSHMWLYGSVPYHTCGCMNLLLPHVLLYLLLTHAAYLLPHTRGCPLTRVASLMDENKKTECPRNPRPNLPNCRISLVEITKPLSTSAHSLMLTP
jgi:hypothetical protein